MKPTINHRAVEKIAAGWHRRASVRGDAFHARLAADGWDPAVPDYPVALVPFAHHPCFTEAEPEQHGLVLTLAWAAYNQRVITAEDDVANPAFALVQRRVFPGADTPAFRNAVQQTLIDEHWHTHMHDLAMRQALDRRGVDPAGWFPPSITYRTLLAHRAAAAEAWERDLLTLVWTVVSEISINALLSLLAGDSTIQPLHRTVTALHAKDESAHGAVMAEVAKALWIHMTRRQQERFAAALPEAVTAFGAQDLGAWAVIIERAGLGSAPEVLADCAGNGGPRILVRDYRGVARLAGELGIADRLADGIPLDLPDPADEPLVA